MLLPRKPGEKRKPPVIDLKPRQIKWSNLNLFEEVFGISRQALRNETSKNKVDLSDYEQAAKYLVKKLEKRKLK